MSAKIPGHCRFCKEKLDIGAMVAHVERSYDRGLDPRVAAHPDGILCTACEQRAMADAFDEADPATQRLWTAAMRAPGAVARGERGAFGRPEVES